jgi:hypothetical protein
VDLVRRHPLELLDQIRVLVEDPLLGLGDVGFAEILVLLELAEDRRRGRVELGDELAVVVEIGRRRPGRSRAWR